MIMEAPQNPTLCLAKGAGGMSMDNSILEVVASAISQELHRFLSDVLTQGGEIRLECRGESVSFAARTRLGSPPDAFYAPGAKKKAYLDLRLLLPHTAKPECVERSKRWVSDTHASLVAETRNGRQLPEVSVAVSVDEGGKTPKLVLKLP